MSGTLNLLEEAVNVLAERQIRFSERFIPYFLSSFGCHCFNLVNRRRGVYFFQSRVPDTRMQILFTAPPGWSKSLFMKQLLDPDYGLLQAGLFMLPNGESALTFEGSVTEAGWTGSSKAGDGGVVEDPGLAKIYDVGVVGMEEFAAIQSIIKQEHSRHLEQSIALALFGGEVRKRLKGLPIKYHTDMTAWCGNQVAKFDISGGLFRRFFHMFWIPRLDEAEALKDAMWDGDNVYLNRARLYQYRAEVRQMWDRLNDVREIHYTENVRGLIHGIPHYEQIIFKNFALGYNIMRESRVPQELVVDVDPMLITLMKVSMKWRRDLLADPMGRQMEQLIFDVAGPDGRVRWSHVRDLMLLFSIDFQTSESLKKRLFLERRLGYKGDMVWLMR